MIDWPCRIERLSFDVNLGCSVEVSRAITWFYEQAEEGIIVGNGCVFHLAFFPYCNTLLSVTGTIRGRALTTLEAGKRHPAIFRHALAIWISHLFPPSTRF